MNPPIRLLFISAAMATVVASVSPARAQFYDPCQPPGPGNPFSALILHMDPRQRASDCQRTQDAAARQQRAADSEQKARAAEADRQAAQARAEAEARVRAVQAAQDAAEASPDNFCREPDTARHLISEYNDLDWPGIQVRKVVDIEHLVTIKKDAEKSVVVCHGVWVHINGARIEGTMTMRPNVAGDIIVSWNFRHIVHFQKVPRYNAVNTLNGYGAIAINTPAEVLDYDE